MTREEIGRDGNNKRRVKMTRKNNKLYPIKKIQKNNKKSTFKVDFLF